MGASDKKHNVRLGQTVVVFCFAMMATNMAFGQGSPDFCQSVLGPSPGQIATLVTRPVEQYYLEDNNLSDELTILANISDQTGIQIEYIGLECYSLDTSAPHTWSFTVPNATEVALRVEASLTPGSFLSFTWIRNDTGTPETSTITASELDAEGGEWEPGIAIGDTVYLTLTTGSAPLAALQAGPELTAMVKAKIPQPFYDTLTDQEKEAVINAGPFEDVKDVPAQLQTNAAPVFKVVVPMKFIATDAATGKAVDVVDDMIQKMIAMGSQGSCTGWNAKNAGGNINYAFTNWHCAPMSQGGGIVNRTFLFTDSDPAKTKKILTETVDGGTANYPFLYNYQIGPPSTADKNAVEVKGAELVAIGDETLDFTLLKISDTTKKGLTPARLALTNAIAPIELAGCTQSTEKQPSNAHIPQHPGGKPKKVVRFSDDKGTLGKIIGVAGADVTYDINTKGGSSGSPVYQNTSNKVCALHNSSTGGSVNHGVNLQNIMSFTPKGGTKTIKEILGL